MQTNIVSLTILCTYPWNPVNNPVLHTGNKPLVWYLSYPSKEKNVHGEIWWTQLTHTITSASLNITHSNPKASVLLPSRIWSGCLSKHSSSQPALRKCKHTFWQPENNAIKIRHHESLPKPSAIDFGGLHPRLPSPGPATPGRWPSVNAWEPRPCADAELPSFPSPLDTAQDWVHYFMRPRGLINVSWCQGNHRSLITSMSSCWNISLIQSFIK